MERLADRAAHLVLPALCLATGQIAFLSRFARAGMIEARSQDYIRTARAKGLPERTVTLRHALANALLPLITLAGFTLPALAGGAVIIERIFSWPGAGRLLFDSIQRRDLTTLMGLTLVGAVLTQAGTLLADILYAAADPRIRYGREEKGGQACRLPPPGGAACPGSGEAAPPGPVWRCWCPSLSSLFSPR
jgi:peptide/nickel transport system permease protein